MKIVCCNSTDQVASVAAKLVSDEIKRFNPTVDRLFILGLPTGSTPLKLYEKLIELYKNGKLSFENVVVFNMDEYIGLPKDDPNSYYTFMKENFFNHIDIKSENTYIPNGNAIDLDLEADNYESKIKEKGGIDLFICGIGSDGHIAFNEPGSSFKSRTRVIDLTEETILANSRFFNNNVSLVPRKALTIGINTLMDSKKLCVLATGYSKALASKKIIEGPLSVSCPASCIQNHENCYFVIDEKACNELKLKTYKYYLDQSSDLLKSL